MSWRKTVEIRVSLVHIQKQAQYMYIIKTIIIIVPVGQFIVTYVSHSLSIFAVTYVCGLCAGTIVRIMSLNILGIVCLMSHACNYDIKHVCTK